MRFSWCLGVFAVAGAACVGGTDSYYYFPWTTLYDSDYSVTPSEVTPKGIAVDRGQQTQVPLEEIDRITDHVEQCLREEFGDTPVIPADLRAAAWCQADKFELPIRREHITVKIADDWVPSCDGSQQLLPVLAQPDGCIAKGLDPTQECPCRWRAVIQDGTDLVVTPSLYLYQDVLIRLITTCANPWAIKAGDGSALSKSFAKCASPIVPMQPAW